MSISKAKIRLSAMNFLARREHAKKELASKLQIKYKEEHTSEQIEQLIKQVINELIDDDLLSEYRFTETFIRFRQNKGFGPIKIRHELDNREVDVTIIDMYLAEISKEQWLATMKQQYHKKFGSNPAEGVKDRLKQSRFLYQRGFPAEWANNIIYH